MSSVDQSMYDAMTPLYRAMGGAIHVTQSFEHSLCYLLALITEHRVPDEPQVLSASFDLHSSQTLGRLIRELPQALPDLPVEIETYLREGLEMRNRLVHGFFSANAHRLIEPKGRLELEEELKEMTVEIRYRDKIICTLIDKYLAKYGLSTKHLAERTDAIWRALNLDAQPDFPPSKH